MNEKNFFKTIKISLKHILKNPNINFPKINTVVSTCHKIVTHTLLFMKLYLLHHFNYHNSIPEINHDLVNTCMKILCTKSTAGRKPNQETQQLKDDLTFFYETHYK